MKIIPLLLLIGSFCFSQKLETNKIDEFTKDTVKFSTWETLENSGAKIKVRSFQINSLKGIQLEIFIRSKAFSISSGDEFIFLFDDDETLTLENQTLTFSDWNGSVNFSAEKIVVSYLIPDEYSFEKLKTKNVKKIRIYTSGGYIEDSINAKHAKNLRGVLKLIE